MMSVVPTKIKLSAPGGILIEWSDGQASIVSPALLRRNCPCATCKENPPQPIEDSADSLPIITQQPIRALRASPVGHYAIQFFWNDGHDAGIYSFDYLLELARPEESNS